jgi:glutamate/tyrosine decarboxylase-like PLP-dependent enzyme
MAAPEGAAGSTTSGGTESILMAVKTALDWARDHLPKAVAPEMVLPRAAHPAFDKAGHMMGIKVHRMATSVDYRADLDAMADAIGDNTIMIVGSAPSYPYGISDPIAGIAAMAEAAGLWMHVDACNGGCVFPFAHKLGYTFPEYDFSIPGVTSISVDVHKLGYANKGVSTLLFRDAALEAYQRYTLEDWPSGTYSTANITGSRSGGGIASAWAVMSYLGEEGYLRIVGSILEARDRMVTGIGAIDGLEVNGEPHAYILTFGSEELDIYAVAEGMEARGWLSGLGLEPDSIHLFLNGSHAPAVDGYLADLASVVAEVKAGRIVSTGARAVYTT